MEKRWLWPFELEEQIGAGAMGTVYRARFVKNDRRVALKLLPPDVAANPTLAARFQREMELLKDLRHPNIVHCFGGTCEGDQWFYAMELVEGGLSASLIQEQGRLPWRQAIEFALQTCAALEHAHERQIIHRDLKPGNLLISKAGRLKLSDFGLAQMVTESKLTAAGKTVGSLHYMAPEQIQGKPPLSSRTDLYALGCVLYETLTGRPPFLGSAMAEVLQRHVKETPQPVASIALDCPPALEALVAELLAKDPAERPPSAQSVAGRLREIDQGVTLKMPRFDKNRPLSTAVGTETVSTEIVPPRAKATNRWLIAGLVLAGVVAGWLLGSAGNSSQSTGATYHQLTEGLRDPEPKVRIFATRVLGEGGRDAAVATPALIEALADRELQVRIEAAKALGNVGVGSDAMLAVRKATRVDDSTIVRDAAAQAEAAIKGRPEEGASVGMIVLGLVAACLAIGGAVWGLRQAAKSASQPIVRSR